MILRDIFGAPAFKIADRQWQCGFPYPFIRQMKAADVDLIAMSARDAQPDATALRHIKRECPQLSILLCPFDDTDEPDALDECVRVATGAADVLVEALCDGKTVLSTCAAGRNRSGLISGLVLIKRFGLTGKEAVERIRLARPNALTNDMFRGYLESL